MFTVFLDAMMNYILFASCLFLLIGSLYISIKLRFIQLTLLPNIFKIFARSKSNNQQENQNTVSPYKALITAMSTTLGIGSIAGPVIAIHLGGPGALLGFLISSILGSAATFTEVSLCVKFRNKLASGLIIGGPMEYLKKILSPAMAKWYALSCCILMTVWSGAQANQLTSIFNSSLLGDYSIPPYISGFVVALLVFFVLCGGIKRISSVSSKIVPLMFALFLGSALWILFLNIEKMPSVLETIFSSAFTPYAMVNGTLVGGIVSALRWGIFKGTQATEAGVGTQTIPHSMTNSNDAISQGTLSMISTYTAGFLSFISGCVVLVTGTWQDPELPLGISMMAASFYMYFSYFGLAIIAVCAFLFGFGTCLGNSYNGSQCFIYLTDPKKLRYYFVLSSLMIFLGSIADVKIVWSVIDIFLAGMAIPHMFALMKYVRGSELNNEIKASLLAQEQQIYEQS